MDKYVFYQFIEDGDNHMRTAERNLTFKDFSGAQNEYWHAANCYNRAMEIANKENDVLALLAQKDLNVAKKEFDQLKNMGIEK